MTIELTEQTFSKTAKQGIVLVDWCAAFEIRAIPTLMAFRDGALVFEQSGALPPTALDRLVEAVKALDMDDVRRRAAAAPPPPSP